LRAAGITLNRNVVPGDPNGAWYTSGLRMGTPAVTTLGMGTEEMVEIADVAHSVLSNTAAGTVASGANAGNPSRVQYVLAEDVRNGARRRVAELLGRHPLYPEIELSI
jgi:glycine hydroxymethyltransferase